MTRTKLILAGLIAGTMALGTACKSDKAAERGEPTEPMQEDGGTGGSMGTDTQDEAKDKSQRDDTHGYEKEDFQGNQQQFGGDSFPSDNERVNRSQNRD